MVSFVVQFLYIVACFVELTVSCLFGMVIFLLLLAFPQLCFFNEKLEKKLYRCIFVWFGYALDHLCLSPRHSYLRSKAYRGAKASWDLEVHHMSNICFMIFIMVVSYFYLTFS